MSTTKNPGRPRAPASVRATAARLSRLALDALASIATDHAVPADARIAAAKLLLDTALSA